MRTDAHPDGAKPVRAIAVLGMHRSGTSALAGSLAESGAFLGDVLGHAIAFNRKGLQEPASIVFMHEHLLEMNGGSWDNPPSDIEWGKLHKGVRNLFLESRIGKEPWAFKDPRTLLVLEGWLDAYPELSAIGIFRDPISVARSLNARNGFSLLKGLSLWQTYNERLLYWTKRMNVPIIEFSADPSAMQSRLDALMVKVGLSFPNSPRFFDPTIPRAPSMTTSGLAETDRLYEALKECALDP